MLQKLKIETGITRRIIALTAALLLVFAFGFHGIARAALTNATLTVGDSRPGETTTYSFDVSTVDTGTDIACIQLDLGSSSDGSGSISGLDTSSSTLDSNGIVSGLTVDNSGSANHVLEASGTAATPSASGTIVFGNVVNGDTADTSYFGVFTTFSDTGCTTSLETITVGFIYTNGQAVSATIDPTFTFSVAGVGNAQPVNGATTNVDISGATDAIPFGTVTAGTNAIVAQDLSITTNADNGYNIYARYTGALTNGSYNIPDVGAFTAFPTGENEDFGITSEDSDVQSSSFTSNTWNSLTTSDQAVADNSVSPGSTAETTRVGFQLGVASTTPSGEYETTVIYTAVPTY